MFLTTVSLLSMAILGHASSQLIWGSKEPPPNAASFQQSAYAMLHYDNEGSFTPMRDLSALSVDSFSTLHHPSFPGHSVRIKRTDFICDGVTLNSTVYTGYIDSGVRHLFYYFFESRGDPTRDDVIMWINGGPGCISSMGVFMENGPCLITSDEGPKYNQYSWNNRASVFYVDQPVGVGYSFADNDEYVSTTEEAARDIAAFVHIFFSHFESFQGLPFHMSGESYAGHYLPIFAARIYDRNFKDGEEDKTKVNLTSLMIGNGLVDYVTLYPSYYDVQCTTASTKFPISDVNTCLRMEEAIPQCQALTYRACIDTFDAIGCETIRDFCEKELRGPYIKAGMNPYDIRKKCEGPPEVHCYPAIKFLTDYLSKPETRQQLGVNDTVPEEILVCNDDVSDAFAATLDEYHPTYRHIAQLLDRGVRVLIYAGDADWICNWIANERWTLEMTWSGQEEFKTQALRNWYIGIDGNPAGKTRSAKGLTYATVAGAGHMVPLDKPAEALELVNRWISNRPI